MRKLNPSDSRPAALLSLLLLLFYSPTEVSARQTPPAALEFTAQAPLLLTPGGTAKLHLRNNTAQPIPVTLKVVPAAGHDSAALLLKILVTPDVETVPGAGAITIKVTAPGDLSTVADFGETYLVAFGGSAFARIKLGPEPQFLEEPAPPPSPNVATWTARVTYSPWFRDNSPVPLDEPLPLKPSIDTPLPLKPVKQQTAVRAGTVLVHLVSKDGRAAAVEVADSNVILPGGLNGLKMRMSPSVLPGKYEGKTGWQSPTDDKDDATFTVYVSHHFLFPLLTLCAGIALAFFFRHRYVSVTRPLLLLREWRANLEADFAAARTPPGKTYTAYDVTDDFRREMAELGRKISDLNRSSFNSPDAAAVKAIETRLEELEALVAAWKAFPLRLARLEEARDALTFAPGTPRPFSIEALDTPAVYKKATWLLQGNEITLARLKVLDVEVKETTERLSKWEALNANAARLSDAIHVPGQPGKLKTLTEDKQAELEEADKQLFRVWDRLWREDAYANDETARALAASETVLIELLRHEVEPVPAPELAAAAAVNGLIVERDEGIPADSGPGALARAGRLRALRLLLDWTGLILTAVIALYTGMAELYFDQAFGAFKDYVAAFLWGFGANAILTVLLAGLNMAWTSRHASRPA